MSKNYDELTILNMLQRVFYLYNTVGPIGSMIISVKSYFRYVLHFWYVDFYTKILVIKNIYYVVSPR